MNETAFTARPPWWGGDLQTLRNFLLRVAPKLHLWTERELELPLRGDDRLLASLHAHERLGYKPLAILIHGLTGCADSSYIRATARSLLEADYPVLRLNLRGAGATRALCQESYHAGRTQDLREALTGLAAQLPAAQTQPVLLIGYSLGGNMLLKFLGEGESPWEVAGAASISAPIDLKASSLAFLRPRNRLYHNYLLRRMKAETRGADPKLLRGIRTVYDFDDRIVAPANGFADAEDYYARSSALAYLPKISTPTLAIHALDDPWVPSAPYRSFDWSSNLALRPLLPRGGGHVGFHGQGDRTPWHDRKILEFLSRI
ncbi:MAG: alpha/beta fold hydrolase [Rhodovibrionaceae bacterium]